MVTNCDWGADIIWGSPWVTGLCGSVPKGLCSLGKVIDHILSCVGAWADMEDYKGHVGAPAKCHILYGKCIAWKQLSICASCEVTWVPSIGQMRAVLKNQSSRPLTGGKDFVDPDNIPNNYSGLKK